MIYAIRQRGSRQTLVEMTSTEWKAMIKGNPDLRSWYPRIDRATAEAWVRSGKEHETGLFINNDGKVVDAGAEA